LSSIQISDLHSTLFTHTMTNENATGGTALVNPSAPGFNRVLRSTAKNSHDHLEDAALVKEEEQIMDVMDEEVTSVEDNHEDNHEETSETSVEKTMMTVALVKSIVETTVETLGDDTAVKVEEEAAVKVEDEESPTTKEARYGLRKRRRPSGQALERLEHLQSTTEGGLARSTDPKPPLVPAAAPPPVPRGPARIKKAATSAPMPSLACTSRRPGKSESSPSSPRVAIPTSISSVPNPLSKAALPASGPPVVASATKNAPIVVPSSVPCPLPAEEPDEIVSAPPQASVDPTSEANDRRKVTINEPAPTGNRIRGFSIDMDCTYL
jgi:hypothetical protein